MKGIDTVDSMKTACISVLVIWTALCMTGATAEAAILNPSFEYEHNDIMPLGMSTGNHETWGMPDDWDWRVSGRANGRGTHKDDMTGWVSDGDWSLYIFVATYGHSLGDYVEFQQEVDFTGFTELLFDVRVKDAVFSQAYVAVGSEKLWTLDHGDTLFDVTIDVGSFSGIHELRLGVEVLEPDTSGADCWTYYDNFRLVPEPASVLLLGLSGLGLLRRRTG